VPRSISDGRSAIEVADLRQVGERASDAPMGLYPLARRDIFVGCLAQEGVTEAVVSTILSGQEDSSMYGFANASRGIQTNL
jgi:hypothetical protein